MDGIIYTARHDDSVQALALFERAAHKVRAVSSQPLSGSNLRTLRLLDRYGIGLLPPDPAAPSPCPARPGP